MRAVFAIALLVGLQATAAPLFAPCRRIQIVPFTGKNKRSDRFGLKSVVESEFKKLGFEVVPSASDSQSECQVLRCEIIHTEHYWEAKSDTVSLVLYDGEGHLLRRYVGWSSPYEMTFKSGFTNATRAALNQIHQADF